MTEVELARYLARIRDARNAGDLRTIRTHVEALPDGEERDTLLRTLKTMLARRAEWS